MSAQFHPAEVSFLQSTFIAKRLATSAVTLSFASTVHFTLSEVVLAFEAMEKYHPAMRIYYARKEAGWERYVDSQSSVKSKIVELTDPLTYFAYLMSEQKKMSLRNDLEGTLWKAAIYYDASQSVLHGGIVIHHVLTDNTSNFIILRHLENVLTQIRRLGSEATLHKLVLPAEGTSYIDFAHMLNAHANSPSFIRNIYRNRRDFLFDPSEIFTLPPSGGDSLSQKPRLPVFKMFTEQCTQRMLHVIKNRYHVSPFVGVLLAMLCVYQRRVGRGDGIMSVTLHAREIPGHIASLSGSGKGGFVSGFAFF